MVDPTHRRHAVSAVDATNQAAPPKQHDRNSQFAKALYAALRPPSIDNADAAGEFENEEETKAPMKVTVLPKSPIKAALGAPTAQTGGKQPSGT